MKNLLILAYDFPPYVSAGALRPYSWYKYMREFGVYPIVITRQWNNKYGNQLDYIAPGDTNQTNIETSEMGTIIRAPYFLNFSNILMLKFGKNKFKFLRKCISAYYEFAQWLFFIGPKSQIYFAANEYLKTKKVDLIVATGDPFILFKYASKLSEKYNVPWIADYRDPWTQEKNNSRNIIMKIWNAFFEKKILKNACAITTVSEFVKINISTLVKGKRFYILPNGYDPDAIEKIKEIKQPCDLLNIAISGTIYKWHPIKSFIEVISNFIQEKKSVKLKLNFYGINIASELNELISSDFPQIKQNIDIFSKMPHDLHLQELTKNNLMLLFNYYSYMGTKIYDYLAINRTILLCYANDEEALKLKEKYFNIEEVDGISRHLQEDLIKETDSGYIVQDAKHLRGLLEDLYDEFIKNGSIKCNIKNAEKYSRKHQIKILAEIIKKVSAENKHDEYITNNSKHLKFFSNA